ncbi:anti-sigma factor family protein [Aporhodopirellula aestuarii]|uniref:Zinc-finger domain-containing protein n=1 Tax=Aporhodopirellula aestuarii TaxID=2950107 RepID=A0ABT0U9M4_9BACT|nr:hypothetical protein [Aporhodopirellula aestuarii]MCM2373642.1 hypothetical protein [Aporhodopirellula aestuarii]
MNDQELIRDYLDGRITPERMGELNQLLERDPSARARFREMATLEEGLRDLSVGTDPEIVPSELLRPQLPGHGNRLWMRPLAAAVSGLAAGVLFTSAIWAATGVKPRDLLTLIHESFETGPAPQSTGFPVTLDVWSGDYTEIATAAAGVEPSDGERMLRFLRADYEGKSPAVGYFSDVYRVISLQSYASLLAKQDAVASLSATFSSITPTIDPKRFRGGLEMHALSAMPEDVLQWNAILSPNETPPGICLATTRRLFDLTPSVDPWHKGRVDLQLPADARFLIVKISVCDQEAGRHDSEPPAIEFDGQFVDDVHVALTQTMFAAQ